MDEDMKFRMDGCCSARTGANLIGMLYGIVAFYFLISSADYAIDVFRLADNEDVKRFLDTLGLSSIAKYNILGVKTLKTAYIASSVIHGITYVSSALLVIGVNNRDGRLVLPWILYSIVLLVLYVIAMLLAVAVTIALYGALGFAAIVGPAVAVLFLWSFFIVVVKKHYSELTEVLHLGDIDHRNSAVQQDNGNTSTPQGVSYVQQLTLRGKQDI